MFYNQVSAAAWCTNLNRNNPSPRRWGGRADLWPPQSGDSGGRPCPGSRRGTGPRCRCGCGWCRGPAVSNQEEAEPAQEVQLDASARAGEARVYFVFVHEDVNQWGFKCGSLECWTVWTRMNYFMLVVNKTKTVFKKKSNFWTEQLRNQKENTCWLSSGIQIRNRLISKSLTNKIKENMPANSA